MQRITWIHERLNAWAAWRLSGSSRRGGYCSPVYNIERVSQTDDVRAGMRYFDLSEDSEAMDTDRAVATLPDELKVVICFVYSYDGSLDEVAKRLRITRATLHRRLCHADIRLCEWFDLKKELKAA